jgi:hypothetical protein
MTDEQEVREAFFKWWNEDENRRKFVADSRSFAAWQAAVAWMGTVKQSLTVGSAKGCEGEAVATVESVTNGSYHRNYRITWHRQVDAGAKLYTHPPRPDADAISAEDAARLLPGPYYMDPPDGGDVPLLTQLQRMAKDAARYRWLREGHPGTYNTIMIHAGAQLDQAIDQALASSAKGRIGTNTGHGHVWERPDGVKARCGGPSMCTECARDQALAAERGDTNGH